MNKYDITETLKGFTNLAEFRDFIEEKINDGQEISRGKDDNDKSKEEKKDESEESEAPTEGGEGEGGGEAEAEAPVIDPVAAPGSQIALGNKVVDAKDDPEAMEVKISGKSNKLNMKPTATIDDSNV